MVSVSVVVAPRTALVGGPSLNVSVLTTSGAPSSISVPVIVPLVLPAAIISGLALTPLKSVPATAVLNRRLALE